MMSKRLIGQERIIISSSSRMFVNKLSTSKDTMYLLCIEMFFKNLPYKCECITVPVIHSHLYVRFKTVISMQGKYMVSFDVDNNKFFTQTLVMSALRFL